ncbi:MAG: hypothetical protein ABIR59_07745 [Gemmatimonadales bacterium]
MTRRRLIGVAVLVAVIVGVAWWWRKESRHRSGKPANGEIALTWRGRYRGNAILAATLNWCPETRIALLQGVSSDTGVVVVLHAASTLSRGRHPVAGPSDISAIPRPGATVALRWVRDSATIIGFHATGGTVSLADIGATASGEVDVRMQKPGSLDTLRLRGTFRRLPVTATAVGCP